MRPHHELRVPLHLHDLCGLLLDHIEFLLADELLVGQQLELVGVLEGAACRRVQRRPQGRRPLHQFSSGYGERDGGGGVGGGGDREQKDGGKAKASTVWSFCM